MPKEPMQIGEQLRSGALWSYINVSSITLLQFALGIVLARILEPQDFGVFIAVGAYMNILQLQVRFGIPNALVQAKDLNSRQINQSFWFMEAIAIAASILVLASASWLEGLYHDNRYAEIMYFSSIMLFIAPFQVISGSLLRRSMDFKSLSKIGIISTLCSAPVSIILALYGLGPYSLVLAGITSAIVTSMMMFMKVSWRPGLPTSFRGFSSLFNYSWKMNASSSFELLSNRVDNMMIGSLLSTYQLGIYNRAFSLSRMPVDQLATSLGGVLISAFSRVQDNLIHSKSMYQKVLCGTALMVFPVLLIFIFTADSFISTLYGVKWISAALPLKIMAAGSFATALTVALRAMIASQGLVGKEIPIQALNLALTAIVVVAGYRWGLGTIAAGIAIKEVIVFSLTKRLLARSHMRLTISQLYEAISPVLIAIFITAGCSYIFIQWLIKFTSFTSISYLFATSFFMVTIYLICIFSLPHFLRRNNIFNANMDIIRKYIRTIFARIILRPR